MRRFRARLLLALGALCTLGILPGLSAHAADCSAIEQLTQGSYTVERFYLLDSDTTSATGTVCDLNTWGAPQKLRVSVMTATGASSGYEVLILGRDSATGVSRELAALTSRNGYQATLEAPIPRHVSAVSRNLTATDFDVIGEALYANATGTAPLACDDLLWATVNPTEAGATDDFMDFDDHAGSTTEDNEDNHVVAAAQTGHRLACAVNAAPGAGDTWLVTLRQGAAGALANTALTCTIADTNTSCASAGSVSLTATNVLTLGVDSSTGATDPTAAASLTCSACVAH